MRRVAATFGAGLLAVACAAQSPPPVADPEGRALAHVAADVLAREACPRLLVRTFSLDDPRARETTGKLWVRKCSVRAGDDGLDVDLDVLGWQWAAESSWGFAIDEYVYFTASIRGHLDAAIEATSGRANLRVASRETPRVEVRAIGRVGAKAETPASSLLGIASGLVGKGPNDLATAAFRGRVRRIVEERAKTGFAIALEDTPVPGAQAKAGGALLDERQALFAGGALLSGSYPPGVETDLRYDVHEGEVLTRAVCVETATTLVDATIAGAPREASGPPPDVITLRASGVTRLAAQTCPWVLVTGSANNAPARASLTLAPTPPIERHGGRRWVKATVVAYEIASRTGDAKLFSLSLGAEGDLHVLGRPLLAPSSRALRLVARPVELREGGALVIRAASLRPLPPTSWLRGTPRFDETELGRGSVVPAVEGGHEERDVAIEDRQGRVGTAKLALDVLEVE